MSIYGSELTLLADGTQATPVVVTVVPWLIAATSAVAAVVSGWLAYKNRRDAQSTRERDEEARLYELARRLHEDLTTGDVERARSVLGHVVHSKMVIGKDIDRREALDSYFRLLWCFERIHAGQVVISASGSTSAEKFFRGMFRWHVAEWKQSIHGAGKIRVKLAAALGAKDLEDSHSIEAFDEVCKYFAKRVPTDRVTESEHEPA